MIKLKKRINQLLLDHKVKKRLADYYTIVKSLTIVYCKILYWCYLFLATTGQYFTYLIVLDFESTCWKDKKMNYGPEISKSSIVWADCVGTQCSIQWPSSACAKWTFSSETLRLSEQKFWFWKPLLVTHQIDLVTVFDAILMSRQTREKLRCLYENLMSNNFRRMAVLKTISVVN